MTTPYGWLQRSDGALELRMPPGVRSDDYVVLRPDGLIPETWRGEFVHRGVPDVVRKYGPGSLSSMAETGARALGIWNPGTMPDAVPLPALVAVKRHRVEPDEDALDMTYWTVVDAATGLSRCADQTWREAPHAVKHAEMRMQLDAQENARVEAL